MSLTNKRLARVIAVLVMFFVAFSVVGMTNETYAATKKPKKMTLTATSKTVDIKGKVTVSVKSVKPAKASKAVKWKTSNKKIATVSSKGVVTGKKAGTVKITAVSKKNKKLKKTIKITVKNLKCTSVSVSGLDKDFTVDETAKATAKISAPKGYYNQGVSWSSSDSTIATVSSSGTVTAKAAGTVTITAKAKDGSGKKASKTINVIDVTDNKPQEITDEEVFNNLTTGKYVLLDVREVETYEQGHVPGSVFVSVPGRDADNAVTQKNMAAVIAKYGKSAKYAILCNTGSGYAQAATKIMIKKGVRNSNIFTVTGGYNKAWSVDYPDYIVTTGKSSSGIDFNDNLAADKLKNAIKEGDVYTVVDVRETAENDKKSVVGSVSAPCAGTGKAAMNAADIKANLKKVADANPNGIFVLVCYSGNNFADLATKCLRDELGVPEGRIVTLTGGMKAIDAIEGFPVNKYISVETMKADMESESPEYVVLDVREKATYDKGHINGVVPAAVPGHVANSAEGIKNLEAVVDEYGKDAKYALLCNSGNGYAKAATTILYRLGVNADNVWTVGALNEAKRDAKGAMAAWTAAGYPTIRSEKFNIGNVAVDTVNNTVTVNATAQKEVGAASFHFCVSANGGVADAAMFVSDASALDVYDALEVLKAQPWCKKGKTVKISGDDTLASAAAADTENLNADFSKLDVKVVVDGEEIPMSEIIDTTDAKGTIDMAFSGNYEKQKSSNTGCILCNGSCYAGVVTNNGVSIGNGSKCKTTDKYPAGKDVQIVMTLK